MLGPDTGARKNAAPSADEEVRHQRQVGRRRRTSQSKGFSRRERSAQWWLAGRLREGKCKRTGRRGGTGRPPEDEAPNTEKQLRMEGFQASLWLNLEVKGWN